MARVSPAPNRRRAVGRARRCMLFQHVPSAGLVQGVSWPKTFPTSLSQTDVGNVFGPRHTSVGDGLATNEMDKSPCSCGTPPRMKWRMVGMCCGDGPNDRESLP